MSEANKGLGVPDVDEAAARVRDAVGEVDKRIRAFVLERPVMALLGAAGLGYIIARLLGRRR